MTGIAEAVLSAIPRPAEWWTGEVQTVSATTLTVLVRGTTVTAAYLDIPGASLSPGDLVLGARQDSSWFALWRLAGVGRNEIVNPSFEVDGEQTGTPTGWTTFVIAGAPVVSTQRTGYAPSGEFELAVSAGTAAQDTYVYSSPIAVTPGQTWAASAFATAVYPSGGTIDADVALYALWFANSTNLYPTTAAADTLIGQVNNIAGAPSQTSVSGTVTVPGGVAYMRIATRSITNAFRTIQWDSVVARRTG